MDDAARKNEETTLIERSIAGDADAFQILMRRHMPRCFRIARQFGLSQEDAADAVQEAFISAFQALDKFNFSFRFSTWITRILLNKLSNWRRTLRRAQKYFTRPSDQGAHIEFESAEETPEQQLENRELRTALENAVSLLPEKWKRVFILFEIEGFKTREIANIINIPEGTVTSRLHHARLSLRKTLKEIST